MKVPVHTVKPSDSVANARVLLAQHRFNQVPVIREQKLVGIVTDRDLRDAPELVALSSLKTGENKQPVLPDPAEIRIEQIMTSNLLTLSADDTIEQAARMMVKERIGSVPIVEKKSHLVAILTRTDVLQAFLSPSRVRKTEGSRHERTSPTLRKGANQKSKPPRHSSR
jgi:acetoin utilization protein AcuB